MRVPPTVLARVHDTFGPTLRSHPSGRPWLAGSVRGGEVVHARTAHLEIALVGTATIDAQALAARIRTVRSVADLDEIAAGYVESDLVLFAREDDRIRAQAPAFLSRSVFWTSVAGIVLVSDEQRPLAAVADAGVDPAVLAGRLTNADVSHPFALGSIWAGVRGIGPGEWLDLPASGVPRPRRWWTAPKGERTIADLAPRLNARINEYVRQRTAAHDVVSSDLSGGLDSTSLSFFLAETGKTQHTLFFSSVTAANTDQDWSRRAAREIGSHHIEHRYAAMIPMLVNGESATVSRLPEGPSMSSVAIGSVGTLEELLGDTGSSLHLNGHAGDALFGALSTLSWTLARSSDPKRFGKLRRHRAVNHYPRWPMLRMLTRNEDYHADLMRIATSDFATPDDGVAHYSRWVTLPRPSPTLSDTAHQLLRELAKRAIDAGTEALAEYRMAHQTAQFLTAHGAAVRQMNLARSERSALRYDSPFLDRQIVDLALSLTISERFHQLPAKPLLAAARPARMGQDYFLRRDKGNYSAEVFAQHKELKAHLRELFGDGSLLEDMGLVSAGTILHAMNEFSLDGRSYTDLAYIGFAEKWLRSVKDAAGQPQAHRQEVGSADTAVRG